MHASLTEVNKSFANISALCSTIYIFVKKKRKEKKFNNLLNACALCRFLHQSLCINIVSHIFIVATLISKHLHHICQFGNI